MAATHFMTRGCASAARGETLRYDVGTENCENRRGQRKGMPFESLWPVLLGNRVVASVALVIALLALRYVVARVIRGKEEILSGERRAWLARVRNLAVIIAAIGLVLIWLPALHTFALSITAFAVALVIATKELILCLSGTVLRTLNRPFEVGKQRVVITLFCPTPEAFQMERAVSAVVLGEYWRRRNGAAAPSTHTPQEKP
ncbi:MAG: hypothetical protein U5L11_17045 [Arhodomonas sp.]|nr:hypothetical protein [Arhodomonas sp.]